MQHQHLAEDQSQVPRSDIYPSSQYTSTRRPPIQQSHLYSGHSNYGSDTDSDRVGYRTGNQGNDSRQIDNQRDDSHADHVALSEPPPTYEQSLFASSVPAWFPNPFSRSTTTTVPRQEQSASQLSAPRLTPRNAPSAPPVSLLATTSGNSSSYNSDDSPGASASSVKRGKRPMRNRQAVTANFGSDDAVEFGGQSPMSPSYLRSSNSSSAASSPLSTKEHGYFDSLNSSAQHMRTARRLEHKQAAAQTAASAPELHRQYRRISSDKPYSSSTLAPQSEISAPPPRLLKLRSRNPSSVPRCPYPLCQKPIRMTKTRQERGATVWLACGLLFICNTYWTSHVVIDYFSSPSRDRVLSRETQAASLAASSGFTARKEAAHLVKGLLGLKSQRYQDPNLINYQRHLNGLNRPTVATVGVVTDEQSAWRAILTLLIIALMAMVRGLMCLSPLMVRSLFDTIHSCPHSHPYPYPEEVETERKLLEGYDLEGIKWLTPEQQKKLASMTPWYNGDEKKRLREKDEAEAAAAAAAAAAKTPSDQDARANSRDTSNMAVVKQDVNSNQGTPASEPSRFRFFQRVKEIRQDAKEKSEQARAASVALAVAAAATIKKKKLPWGIRRAVKLAQEKRLRMVAASQDIGRYCVLYEIESLVKMDWLKGTVFAQDKVQHKSYQN
ncbi:hypothetical protein BGZ80_002994 [Entomortierella chlamydospora]|uniref:Uncharacterized protein n=1 Tax=Entomortierella chlamydospora TaxID=101097 RepID=A0A9P6N2A8_9FUNG|nr:hypothetical protein BGZ79_005791 [Entomortierella chlamydospora]KAG0021112.1 hypothetical protein BGZ80_002994 [Entomortierella chlamydospora]